MRIIVLLSLLAGVVAYAGYSYVDKGYIDVEKLEQKFGLAPRLIDDKAELLADDDEKHIIEYHQVLLRMFDIDYRIYTARNLSDINQYAWETFNDEEVGSMSKQGRGLLLVIDPGKNKLRIEVSGNLESIYTDAFVSYLENRQMVPFFKLGRVDEGIFATSELIRTRAIQAQEGIEFDPSSVQGSLGGGVSTDAGIGEGRDTTFTENKPDILAADTPEETHRRFMQSFADRNGRWDLDIYTDETKQHMGDKVISAAQMDNAFKTYSRCVIEHVTFNKDNTLAVLAYSLSNRGCDPFMFEKGADGKWRLDLRTVGTALGHTYGNIWYLDFRRYEMSGVAKYNFGFRHLDFRRYGEHKFDHQGIPYYRKYGMHANYVTDGSVIRELNGEDSFMAKQGFQVGDVILQWESELFPHQYHIGWRMEGVRPGLDIYTRIRRGNTYFEKTFKAPPYPEKGKLRFGVSYRSYGPNFPLVHYVEPGALADKLGLKEGDQIASWHGVEGADRVYISKLFEQLHAGDELTAKVYRDGNLVSLSATVGEKRKMGKVQ